MAYLIPPEVRQELFGLELSLCTPSKIAVVGQPTVGNSETVDRYTQLCMDAYPVSNETLLAAAHLNRLPHLRAWVLKSQVSWFFFTSENCEYQP